MIVFNSQKLNQAVKELVNAAEAATGKARPYDGFRMSWIKFPGPGNQ